MVEVEDQEGKITTATKLINVSTPQVSVSIYNFLLLLLYNFQIHSHQPDQVEAIVDKLIFQMKEEVKANPLLPPG